MQKDFVLGFFDRIAKKADPVAQLLGVVFAGVDESAQQKDGRRQLVELSVVQRKLFLGEILLDPKALVNAIEQAFGLGTGKAFGVCQTADLNDWIEGVNLPWWSFLTTLGHCLETP
jgi:hypothetical protein